MAIWPRRAYDEPVQNDGFRVLVDRLWPRGVSKNKIRIDDWMRDLAPSTELRKRFHHQSGEWTEFKKLYFGELEEKRDLWEKLLEKAKDGRVTLIYGSKNEKQNNDAALKEFPEEKMNK